MAVTAVKPKTFSFFRGDHLYLVSPVTPFEPAETEIEEFAFANHMKTVAPNPNILWLQGQYVEGDKPNLNGAMWAGDELAIKSLTPNFMPVSVMHDPSTAVGLIADTKLVLPEEGGVEHARLDNTIGVWRHRFPEVAEEIAENYKSGTLMQSMECLPTHYDCSVCGKVFPKLPGGAEEAQWCVHLKGEEGARAARILRNVCFTGTGLIFGSRGVKGALPSAHLEVLEDEVAAFHEAVHKTPGAKPKPRGGKRTMEIEDGRYQELIAAEAKLKELEPKLATAEDSASKVPDLEKKVETLEVEKKAAVDEAAQIKTEKEALEETARSATLATERLSKVGEPFKAKLPETVKAKLDEQAKVLSDEDWTARLEELAALTGVKPDAEGSKDDKDKDKHTFTAEEIAASRLGGGGEPSTSEPSPEARRSVIGSLVGAGASKDDK